MRDQWRAGSGREREPVWISAKIIALRWPLSSLNWSVAIVAWRIFGGIAIGRERQICCIWREKSNLVIVRLSFSMLAWFMLINLCLQHGMVFACDRLKINKEKTIDRLKESDIVSLVTFADALWIRPCEWFHNSFFETKNNFVLIKWLVRIHDKNTMWLYNYPVIFRQWISKSTRWESNLRQWPMQKK